MGTTGASANTRGPKDDREIVCSCKATEGLTVRKLLSKTFLHEFGGVHRYLLLQNVAQCVKPSAPVLILRVWSFLLRLPR